MMTPCSIETGLPKKTVDEFMATLRARVSKLDVNLLANEINTVASQFFSNYKQYPNIFAQMIKDSVENNVLPWRPVAKRNSQVYEALTNVDTIKSLINDNTNIDKEESTDGSKEKALDDPEAASAPKKRSFRTDAYKTSKGAEAVMERTFLEGILHSLLFNGNTFTQTTFQLNQNIKIFQNQLFASIVKYLNSKGKTYDLPLYDAEGNYVGNFDQFKADYADDLKKLQPFATASETEDSMTVSRLDYLSTSTMSRDKMELDAYNAFFILTYFDDLLKIYVKPIEIVNSKLYNSLQTNEFSKYRIGETSRVEEGWQDREREIDITELISLVNKMLIERMPVYKITHTKTKSAQDPSKTVVNTTTSLTNQNVKLIDFLRIMTTIKKIAHTKHGHRDLGPLSEKVKEIFGKEYGTLFEIIGDLNSDPNNNLRHLFELLITPEFKDEFSFTNLGFSFNDENLIYSIYKGCFEKTNIDNQNPSIYQRFLNDPSPKNSWNYYNYISQMCVSVESFLLQQYLNKQGVIQNTTLNDSQNKARSSHLERSISQNFSSLRPLDFQTDYIDKYAIRENKVPLNKDTYLFAKAAGPLKLELNRDTGQFEDVTDAEITFSFRIPAARTYYDVTVYPRSPKVFEISKAGVVINKENPFTQADLEALIPFINDILPTLGIDSIDSNFINIYMGAVGDYDYVTRTLMHLASHVFMNASMVQFIKSKNPQTESDYNGYLKEYYGANPTVKLNRNEPGGGLRSLISTQLDYQMDDVSKVYNQSQGVYGDGIVKDSEGKMINQVGASMLATKIEQQVVTQNLKKNSASKHFSLWKGLYRGIQFTREFAGESSTQATRFNVKEHTMASLIYDFLSAYTNPQQLLNVMPSILSDKSRILKIMLDLNEYSSIPTANGKGFKKYIDLNSNEWKQIINVELGTYYYKVFRNTVNTFDKLQQDSTLKFVIDGNITEFAFTFDYWNNFTLFNSQVEKLNAALKKANREELSVQDVLHAILLNPGNRKVELTDQIHYVISEGKLQLNQLIISELSRFCDDAKNLHLDASVFDIKDKEYQDFAAFVAREHPGVNVSQPNPANTQENLQKYNDEYNAQGHYFDYKWYLDPSGTRVARQSEIVVNIQTLLQRGGLATTLSNKAGSEMNSGQFWKIKQNDLIKDLLSNNCVIHTTNNLYEDLTSTDNPEKLQPQLRCLKYGTLKYSKPKKGEDSSKNDKWYKSGTGWIALARLTYKEPKLDDEGEPVLEDGKPIYETKQYLIASEADVRKLSYTKDGVTISYGDEGFNFYDLANDDSNNYTKFELNPCIETWNTVDFLMGQEFMNSTVGTHLNHPAKKNLNGPSLIEEAERWLAQVKRNVSLSATKHSFALNLLNGIRDTYRIAVVDDDVAGVFNIFGEQNAKGAKPFDGATFVCGTNNYLENYSLGANAAGTNKKQFIHSYKEGSGTGIIIKTAGFPITNAKINQCDFYRRMNKKMMQGKWTTQNPNGDIDITVDYFGNTIDYDSYYFEDGKYYRISYLEKIGKNKYRVYRDQVSEYGEVIATDDVGTEYYIDNNWALWNMFGGSHSKSLVYDTNLGRQVLKDSESSFQNVVLAMNSVSEERFTEDAPPTSQKEVHQNLKYSNIDYVVTAGAIKQGAANINSKAAYYDDNYELTTMEVSMHDSGIQLDAEHHADESTLSLMTQVVNALCARGYALDRSNEVYEALYNLTVENLRPHLEGLSQYLDAIDENGEPTTGNKEALLDSIAGVILKGLQNLTDREGNLVQAVSEVVVQAAKEGQAIKSKDIEGVVPFSHPAMYKQLTSMLSSAFTREGIRIKFSGSLAVLNPSNGIWTVYGDRLLHDFDPDVTKENKSNMQKRIEVQRTMPNITEFSKLRLGYRYYVYHRGKDGKIIRDTEYLNDPKQYWLVRKRLNKLVEDGEAEIEKLQEQLDLGNITQEQFDAESRKHRITVQEDIIDGRDLATYQADFQGMDPENEDAQSTYNIWDLDVVKCLYALKELAKTLKKHKSNLDLALQGVVTSQALVKDLQSWCLDYMPENYQYTSLPSLISDFSRIAGFDINNLANAEKLLRRRLQDSLEAISTGVGAVQIGGKLINVVEGSTNVYPYELIMPKIYATRFGLQKGDSLHDVLSKGSDFFRDRILSKSKSLITDSRVFDIELKRSDGKHTYILYKDGDEFTEQAVRNEFLKQNLKKVSIQKEQDGYSWWRTDYVTGEQITQLSSQFDEVYEYNGNEIIVTDNPKFYLETQNYYAASLSTGVYGLERFKVNDTVYEDKELIQQLKDPLYQSEKVKSILSAFQEVDNTELKDYLDYLGTSSDKGGETLLYKIELYQQFASDPESTDKSMEAIRDRARWYQKLDRVSHEQFLSFKESLKILAARIPAQSMQSFMAMQVVGFDDAGTNEAYVNYWQLWLQGSDYDIDKVSLLGSSFTKDGHYVKWSPFFSFENEETLRASQNLPYPSGISIQNGTSYNSRSAAYYLNEQAEKFVVNGRMKRYLSPNEINELARLIRYVRDINYDVDLDVISNEGRVLVNAIDKHNNYGRTRRKQKQMLMNFIAHNMIDIIQDPINLIQSQSPIDDQADRVKGLTKTSKLARQTDTYAPGNVVSKMNAIILTLTGKDNVGIVASAMKTFEALSFYTNKVLKQALNSNNSKDVNRIVDSVILGKDHEGLTICGQKILLLANSYVNGRAIRQAELKGLNVNALKEALATVNNDEDAFLLISALLSLATDNAKDPTLSKINANQDIIGLYTAGTAIGIDFHRLVHTIMSETGDYLLGWISGNVFQGEEKKSLYKVLQYVDEGPDMSKLSSEALNLLATAIDIYVNDKIDLGQLPPKKPAKTKEEEEKQEDADKKKKEETDSLISDNPEKIKSQLLGLSKRFGSEAIITIFRNATEITKHSYTEMQELQSKIKSKRQEFKETQEVAAHQEAQALQENLNTIKTSKTTRRMLENTFQEWLDYTFKASRIKGEYIDEAGNNYKVWDFFRNQVRDDPYYCNKVGQAYVDPQTQEVHVLQSLTPPKDSDVERYKTEYEKWKKGWDKILSDEKEAHQKAYESYKDELAKYEADKTKTKPRAPKRLNLKEYKEAYTLYLDKVRQGVEAYPPNKPFTFKTPELRNSYEDDILDRAQKYLASMPIYPSPVDKVFANRGLVYNPFESIKILNDVNSEFGVLRNTLSLNQGLPSSPGEQIMALRQFQNILENRANALHLSSKTRGKYAEELGGSMQLDLHKFLYNEKYRTSAINIYNDMKVAVNVLAAAYETPHYRGYLKDLDVLIQGSKLYSSVYRAALNDVDEVLQEFGYFTPQDVENTVNAMGKFYVNILNNLFLQSKDISITLPPGQRYFTSDGTMQMSDTRTTIQLGTPHGNASFKLWFEEYLIPNMKKGNFGNLVSGNISYRSVVPRFIKDMEMVEVDRTPTQNAAVMYSLPVDMLPHSESAIIKFKTYKNELNRMNMNVYYQTMHPETGEQIQVGMPFKNLLFLYNIVAYGMENTQNAFTSIFEDMVRDGSLPIQSEYNEFISTFDFRNDLVKDRDYTMTQLLYWCAPIIYNPRTSDVKYGKYYDPNSLKYILVRYGKEGGFDENSQGQSQYNEDGSIRRLSDLEMSNYTPETNNLPSQYFIRDYIDFLDNQTMHINGETTVEFNNNSIDRVIYNGKTYEISDLIKEYTTKSNRSLTPRDLVIPLEKRNIQGEVQEVPNRQFVEAILSEIFNPCP